MNTGKTAMADHEIKELAISKEYCTGCGLPNEETDAFISGYKAAEQAAEQDRWIAVSERLPEGFWSDSGQEHYKKFSEQVNVFVDNGTVGAAAYNRESKKWFIGDLSPERYTEFTRTNVTHWQPLPPAPSAPDKEKE